MSFNAGSIQSTLGLDAHGYVAALDKAAGVATRFSSTTTTVLQAATNKQQAILSAVGQQAAKVNTAVVEAVKRSAQAYEMASGNNVIQDIQKRQRAFESYDLASGKRSIEQATKFRAGSGAETDPEIRRAMAAYTRTMLSEAKSAGVAEKVQRAMFGDQATISKVANTVAREQMTAAKGAIKQADWTKAWGEENRQAKVMKLLMGGGAIGAIAMVANQAAASITRVGDAMVRMESGQITVEEFTTEMLRAIPVAGELGYALNQAWQWKDRVYIAQIEEATRKQEEHIKTVIQLHNALSSASEAYRRYQTSAEAELSGMRGPKMVEQFNREAANEVAPVIAVRKSEIDRANEMLAKLRGEKTELLATQQKRQADVDHAKTVDEFGDGAYSLTSIDLKGAETALTGVNNDIAGKTDEIKKYSDQIAELTEKMKGLEGTAAQLASKRMGEAGSEKIRGFLTEAKTMWGGFSAFGEAFLSRGGGKSLTQGQAKRIEISQSLEAAGKSLEDSLMTPMEKWSSAVQKAKSLLLGKVISQETYDREVQNQDKLFNESTPKEKEPAGLADFIQRGSADAAKYQAELANMTRVGDKAIEKEHLGVAKETLKAIQGFNASGGGDVIMDIAGGMA